MNNQVKVKPEKIVSATFKTEEDLAEAVRFLGSRGISEDEINILNTGKNSLKNIQINTSNKASENAFKGLTAGLISGAVLGSLFFVGILIIPVLKLAAAGPVIGALAGIAVGITAGSVIGGLTGIKIPKYEAIFFDNNSNKNILLVTKTDNFVKKEIKKKFTDIGALNIVIQ